MTIEKNMVTATEEKAIMEVKDAVSLAKKENISENKANNAREEATKNVKLAVSKYIEELKKKEGSLPKIAKKLYNIDKQVKIASLGETNTADRDPSFLKSLGNWLDKKTELSLYHLCLLTQVHQVSYDYILGLDKKNNANQLSYGYTLDFFSIFSESKN